MFFFPTFGICWKLLSAGVFYWHRWKVLGMSLSVFAICLFVLLGKYIIHYSYFCFVLSPRRSETSNEDTPSGMDSGYEDNVSQPDDDELSSSLPSPPSFSLSNHSLEVQQLREQLDQAQESAMQLLAERSVLQGEMDRLVAVQSLRDQELEELKIAFEAQRQTISQQSSELMVLQAENQTYLLLQDQLQAKVEQLEQAQDGARQLLAERSELQVEMERLVAVQSLRNQELEELRITFESQRQTVLEQSSEMMALQVENHRHVLLQDQLQAKVEQLEEIIQQQSFDLLELRRRNDESSRESDATVAVEAVAKPTESEENDRQSRYRDLQEQILFDLPVRTKRWRTIIEKLRTELELDKRKREQSRARMREKQEKELMTLQLKEAMDQLKNIMSRQQENNRVWQEKYGVMQERFIQELFYTEERGKMTAEEEQQRRPKEKRKKRRERETKEGKRKRREQRKKIEEEREPEKEEKEKEDGKKVKQEVKSRCFFRWWSQSE